VYLLYYLGELNVDCTAKGIYVAEMRFLRALAGHRPLGKESNEDIKQELQMTSLLSIIKKIPDNW
jgi:hypothetical protein